MAFTIAFAGKGGTGKTSLAGLTIKYLLKKNKQPILAVDADSNACLNEALGLKVHATVGRLREESLDAVRSGERPGGMAMEELFDYQVQQSLIESKGIDLMVMGRPEGPGCYCAANNIIRKYTDILSEKYPYVVIDNEAGMEHLSRRTTHAVDMLFIVSDPTVKGLQTAKRINELVDELKLDIKKRVVVINRVPDSGQDQLQKLADSYGLEVGVMIPQDSAIADIDLKGAPIIDLSDEAVSYTALSDLLDRVLAQ
ncbi:MAG: AAA family ATPase [Dissulfurispiraceae bacterium]|jgi:CO dehydrogenase maturation factor|nr:AAA family ATPase [Dissulfurispiraceae bacterium]